MSHEDVELESPVTEPASDEADTVTTEPKKKKESKKMARKFRVGQLVKYKVGRGHGTGKVAGYDEEGKVAITTSSGKSVTRTEALVASAKDSEDK